LGTGPAVVKPESLLVASCSQECSSRAGVTEGYPELGMIPVTLNGVFPVSLKDTLFG